MTKPLEPRMRRHRVEQPLSVVSGRDLDQIAARSRQGLAIEPERIMR